MKTPHGSKRSLGRFRFLCHVRDMKTLLNRRDKEEIIARVQAVRPTSPRRWERMSAHQMVCHLTGRVQDVHGPETRAPVPVPVRVRVHVAQHRPRPVVESPSVV
jgi:hypothetical protein